MPETQETKEYREAYGEKPFWRKIGRFAAAAGKQVIEKALVLYYCLQDPDTPPWARAVIITALGYFILPMDAIPDITPVVGFSDDLGALAGALATVAASIKPAHRRQAGEKVKDWFDKDAGESEKES